MPTTASPDRKVWRDLAKMILKDLHADFPNAKVAETCWSDFREEAIDLTTPRPAPPMLVVWEGGSLLECRACTSEEFADMYRRLKRDYGREIQQVSRRHFSLVRPDMPTQHYTWVSSPGGEAA